MDLEVKDVATLLNVSEETLKEWAVEGKIPSYKINEQYRFSRIEIDDWMLRHKFAFDNKKETSSSGSNQYSLYRAIHKGDVFFNVPGNTKEEIIRYISKQVAPQLQLDADLLSDLLLDREGLMSTALNNKIAVPHTREIVFKGYYDTVIVAFLEKPIDWNALDGQPVQTLFFLFACEDSRHLNLLAKIAHLSTRPSMLEDLKTQESKDQILELIKEWEGKISR